LIDIKKLSPAAALPIGIGLFFLVRSLETRMNTSRLVNVLVEEVVKITLFLLLEAARRVLPTVLKNPSTNAVLPRLRHKVPGLLSYPLLCIISFGITENIAYFLSFPESSIYQRLLYSYPIHLNTGLLYALAFISGKPGVYLLSLLVSCLYHLGLNILSLTLPAVGIYAVGIVNLLLLFFLYWNIHNRSMERSIKECWNPT
jgi:hypothetical protein